MLNKNVCLLYGLYKIDDINAFYDTAELLQFLHMRYCHLSDVSCLAVSKRDFLIIREDDFLLESLKGDCSRAPLAICRSVFLRCVF